MGDLGVCVVRRGGAAPMEPHKEMVALAPPLQEHQHQPPLFLDYSHGDGDGSHGRKRPRETEAPPPSRLLSLQTPQGSPRQRMISLAQLQRRPATTGLRLDFDDGGSEHAACTSSFDDQYTAEMDRLIQEHAERLRRALADTGRRHSRSLLCTAEALAARRARDKESEASRAVRRGAELEEQLARLREDAAAWQAKAMADQSTVAGLHAKLQRAQARSGKAAEQDNNNAAGAADDAESGFVDPDRVVELVAPPLHRPCRACRLRPASTVLLPCRHLCVCGACEPAVSASAACPRCRCPVTGSVQVFFS
ncbi:probable BOI-related E3 ubiquitin-protein ligase 3 isoform X2 [Lolium perenne]|uniref:probable BOI-related E3 ubiquitin-protein ligase 3 isoform X2 n=1 Tax=Lolium perenne TaxID=4522 RepID=UPI0021F6516E|nr:probable BOI-related E3 ubiquitin-protein ligase 3 isoform X2 [Lolium perenne]